MKHFTPELLARCRTGDDAAAEEWDRAIDAYNQRLEAISSRLPDGARRLLDTHTLHDAQLLGVTDNPTKPRANLLVRLESGETLELRYHLVAGPRGGWAVKGEPSAQAKGPRSFVLYDEFDIEDDGTFFTHSLLLSDGKELVFRFHNLRVRLLSPGLGKDDLIPSERTWPVAVHLVA